ncbi:hypothetical protein BC830DRAFT_1172828 [Chytriomyces sp. MP71]|nr:hypothetical protein BC830DRAFT_1172828 [Chytriomyces sp. MP71]
METSVPVDIVGRLPRELSVKILSFLRAPKTLSRCALVSRAWNPIANDDIVWRSLCEMRWKTKKNVGVGLHPRVDYASLAGSLSVREMKELLKARNVDVKGMFEKSEFINALFASLPKNSPMQERVLWRSKWKASFIVAELDAKRVILTKDELCNSNWAFRMKHWPDDVQDMRSTFNQDYTYKSDMFRDDHAMKWRFYANDVQVESYPALTITRDKDWGYTMQNEMAIFHSV